MEQELTQTGMVEDGGSQAISPEGESVSGEKLYTEADLKAARLAQGKSDAALNEALRTLDQQKSDYEAAVEELEELRKEIERKDDEAFIGDAEGRSAARQKRESFKASRELARREKDLQREREEITAVTKEIALKDIAGRYGISPNLLRFANSREEAEELAVAIKTESSKLQPASGFRPDTSISNAGGGRTFTAAQIGRMSMEEYAANAAEISKALREGKIK